ncbi:NPCBM/NEW2 domain-containing protein [Streptomyces althioticus]|uniref:NPCBM/NEW2 domain-containing protein n=1 Tax=Streptomyces althioticus TaxID=83380 RepID=UPI0037D7108B
MSGKGCPEPRQTTMSPLGRRPPCPDRRACRQAARAGRSSPPCSPCCRPPRSPSPGQPDVRRRCNGWGPVERDMSNGERDPADGGPLTLAGTVYDKGLGTHAAGEVVVGLDGGYRRFAAVVGVDDEVGAKGTVVFEVLGDGRTLLTTGVLGGAGPAFPVDVDVTGVRQLTLRVLDGGDGVDSDHADWADARLVP